MNKWLDGAGVPSKEIGQHDDYYLNTQNGDIFKKTDSLWYRIGCIMGKDGKAGENGSIGPSGLNGRDGFSGIDGNSWHDGAGEPLSNYGEVKDYYLDISNGDVYQKTKIGQWERVGNLKGEKGDSGPQGEKGEAGEGALELSPKVDLLEKNQSEITLQLNSKVSFLEDASADFETPSNELVDSLNTLKARVDEHITNHPTGGGSGSSHTHSNLTTLNKITESKIEEWDNKGNTSIDDTTLAKDKAWSSQKTYDFVLANANTTMADINGGDMQTINYTKEGYLSEVELFGSQENQNLGKLVVDGIGNPILDNQGRQQYSINIESNNINLFNSNYLYKQSLSNTMGAKVEVTGIITNNQRSIIKLPIKPNTSYVIKAKGSLDRAVNGLAITDIDGIIVDNKNTLLNFTSNIDSNNINSYLKFTTKATTTKFLNCYLGQDIANIPYDIAVYESSSETLPYVQQIKNSTTLTLPCQLQKVADIKDRLCFDKVKGKYVVEKNNVVIKGVPQIIETNITKEMLVPTYRGKTHVLVTDNVVSGGIKAKAPIDAGQAIQTLSMQTMSLEKENENLRTVNEQQDQLINVSMLATDELYTMIEPSLPQVATFSLSNFSPLADMYVALVLRGLKTIEEIPVRFREDVKAILEQIGGKINE